MPLRCSKFIKNHLEMLNSPVVCCDLICQVVSYLSKQLF